MEPKTHLSSAHSVNSAEAPRRVKPLPPVTLPVTQPDPSVLPDDGQTERDYIMSERLNEWKSKTIFRSRTIITVTVSILGFVLSKFLGLDVDLGAYIQAADGLQVGELILAVGAIIAGYFRKNARADLSNTNG